MSNSTSTVLKVLGTAVVVTLIAFAAFVGPRLYRAGRSVVAPVVEMSRLEDQLAALDAEFPPPAETSDTLDAGRLDDFLAIRRDLAPRYREWDDVVEVVEARGDSWEGARDVLAVTRDVLRAQIDALRSRSMSPSEFRDLERLVYDRWLDEIDAADVTAADTSLADVTRADLEFVREQAAREGRTPALEAVERRLETRIDELAAGAPPTVEGIDPEVAALLWAHRDDIAAVRLSAHPMHSTLQSPGRGGIQVHVGTNGTAVTTSPAPEPTPAAR